MFKVSSCLLKKQVIIITLDYSREIRLYLSNALSNPGAMMVKALYTIVAYRTV